MSTTTEAAVLSGLARNVEALLFLSAEPVTGRETDGENYNIGFVSVGDVPYAPLVQAARAVHAEAYARRYNQ